MLDEARAGMVLESSSNEMKIRNRDANGDILYFDPPLSLLENIPMKCTGQRLILLWLEMLAGALLELVNLCDLRSLIFCDV